MVGEENKAKMAQCFVIGPIGPDGSSIRTAADDFMEFIVRPVVTSTEFGYTPIRADGLNEPGRITSQIIRLLLEADLVIADLTGNNANGRMSANDPGCVKTRCRCYDSPMILRGGIDEALR